MFRRLLQKAIVFTTVLGFVVLLCLANGMDRGRLLDNLVFFILFGWAWIVLDDFIAKLFWYRYAITKEYLKMMALFIGAYICFNVTWVTDVFWLGLVSLIVFILMQGGGFFLYWYYYEKKKDVYISFEIERAKWIVLLKSFKDMSKEDVELKSYQFLRYFPKRNILESSLCLAHPVDKTGKNRTVAEMLKEDAHDESALEAQAAIKTMVADYYNRYHKS